MWAGRYSVERADLRRYDDDVKAAAADSSTQALPKSEDHGACDSALVAAFGLLGKRWNGLILGTLTPDGSGFAELRRAIGTITDSVLSDRLSELARAGLVERTVTDTKPPGVSYRLTGSGSALKPILSQLAGWAGEHLPSCPPGDDIG
jgi:DNA-binding HxlR family transcriptional regulator